MKPGVSPARSSGVDWCSRPKPTTPATTTASAPSKHRSTFQEAHAEMVRAWTVPGLPPPDRGAYLLQDSPHGVAPSAARALADRRRRGDRRRRAVRDPRALQEQHGPRPAGRRAADVRRAARRAHRARARPPADPLQHRLERHREQAARGPEQPVRSGVRVDERRQDRRAREVAERIAAVHDRRRAPLGERRGESAAHAHEAGRLRHVLRRRRPALPDRRALHDLERAEPRAVPAAAGSRRKGGPSRACGPRTRLHSRDPRGEPEGERRDRARREPRRPGWARADPVPRRLPRRRRPEARRDRAESVPRGAGAGLRPGRAAEGRRGHGAEPRLAAPRARATPTARTCRSG